MTTPSRSNFYPRSPRGERPIIMTAAPTPRYFYPRSPRGERLDVLQVVGGDLRFLSTLPARGATFLAQQHPHLVGFLSTLPARGATRTSTRPGCSTPRFLSTLPARGATPRKLGLRRPGRHFYPRSPRGERLLVVIRGAHIQAISIHAPREGSDLDGLGQVPFDAVFLSTLPARGATYLLDLLSRITDISIHAPREGSDPQVPGQTAMDGTISIHAPREGSDRCRRSASGPPRPISIHAPREGSDGSVLRLRHSIFAYFYPRSPRGERPCRLWRCPCRRCHFYPRSPRGERPGHHGVFVPPVHISIHAPREGSDGGRGPAWSCRWGYFYPRSPRGERPSNRQTPPSASKFLSTLPARGATFSRPAAPVPRRDFYPRSPRGERPAEYSW